MLSESSPGSTHKPTIRSVHFWFLFLEELVSILIPGHVTVIYIADTASSLWLLERTSIRLRTHTTFSYRRQQVEGDAWRRCQTALWVIFWYEEADSRLMPASLTMQITSQVSIQQCKHSANVQLNLFPPLFGEFCSRLCLLSFHTPPSVVTFNSASDKAKAALMMFPLHLHECCTNYSPTSKGHVKIVFLSLKKCHFLQIALQFISAWVVWTSAVSSKQ